MWLNRTSAPAETPITLTEAKSQLRVTHTDEDTLISAMIDAVAEHLDGRRGYLGRAIVTQSWEYRVDIFPESGVIELPLPPLQSVESVKYIDDAGDEQTLAADQYVVDTATYYGQVRRAYDVDWPVTRDENYAVRVAFTAGFGAASAVPQPVKTAALMLVRHWYEHRSTAVENVISEMPLGAAYLLGAYRTPVV